MSLKHYRFSPNKTENDILYSTGLEKSSHTEITLVKYTHHGKWSSEIQLKPLITVTGMQQEICLSSICRASPSHDLGKNLPNQSANKFVLQHTLCSFSKANVLQAKEGWWALLGLKSVIKSAVSTSDMIWWINSAGFCNTGRYWSLQYWQLLLKRMSSKDKYSPGIKQQLMTLHPGVS